MEKAGVHGLFASKAQSGPDGCHHVTKKAHISTLQTSWPPPQQGPIYLRASQGHVTLKSKSKKSFK